MYIVMHFQCKKKLRMQGSGSGTIHVQIKYFLKAFLKSHYFCITATLSGGAFCRLTYGFILPCFVNRTHLTW